MALRTSFRFTLPQGTGIKVESGRKASGVMRLVQVKDILSIERDGEVKKGTAAFHIVLLSKVITELGTEKMITRKTIERLSPVDFAFLLDFCNEINQQVIKRIPRKCPVCGKEYLAELSHLGEA